MIKQLNLEGIDSLVAFIKSRSTKTNSGLYDNIDDLNYHEVNDKVASMLCLKPISKAERCEASMNMSMKSYLDHHDIYKLGGKYYVLAHLNHDGRFPKDNDESAEVLYRTSSSWYSDSNQFTILFLKQGLSNIMI